MSEPTSAIPVLSVGEFVTLVNQTLDFAYPRVTIEGEVSDLKIWRERFVYFDLKDDEAIVNCFMVIQQMKTPLEDGMKVQIVATPKLTNKGRFSVRIHSYELAGEGALRRAYELLKQQLEGEGLFAVERKRALPPYPRSIGLITALQSAAYRDFIEILNQRWGGVIVKAVDVQVQGSVAVEQIVAAVDYFDQLTSPVDVLVITRGGGSLEDLQAFNTEPVVRAVAGSRTPTIVGVGHEIDTSLADLAADVRAATPTDAARRVVPERRAVIGQLNSYAGQLERSLRHELVQLDSRLVHHTQQLEQFIQLPLQRVRGLGQDLRQHLTSLAQQLTHYQRQISQSAQSLVGFQQSHLREQVGRFNGLVRVLKTVDPARVLARGYSIVRKGSEVVKSGQQTRVGDELMIQLAQDKLTTEVIQIEPTA
ncbi:exodeoxyribonuclease VII large subunit [Candidatus Microgenomates bacterium]|nr:exodeoxyribonuclease VII large subunit [Candidatus Microgenomates bacterium]